MVVIKNPKEWEFLHFEVSNAKNKKYNAVLSNKKTKKIKRVSFGDKRYKQFLDSTGLGTYSHLDHNDLKRRELYRKRHKKTSKNKYSSSWFSYNFLW